jgi:indole-3-glycerol phosphate synthase
MSVTNKSKRRGTILDEIMMHHREQLPKRKREVPLADLRGLARLVAPPADFAAALAKPGVSLIAECKKASPSKGLLVPKYDPVAIATAYVRAGARAISVLTDGRHFQGSLAHLRDVKEAFPQTPVLRKDFMFDPYQVYEARSAGADAILLIAAVLSDSQISELQALAASMGMASLIEVHTEEELARVLALEPRIVGVNNRNLQTFAVDFGNTARLRAQIPPEVLVVAESGLQGPEDVAAMKAIGVDAILVGETLVKSKDISKTARALIAAGQ